MASDVHPEILARAVDQAYNAVVITTADLDPPGPSIVYVNQAFRDMTGYTEEELIGATPRLLQGPRTDREVLARLRRQLAAGEDFTGSAINYCKDGTPYLVEWKINAVRDDSGDVAYYVSVQRDITARAEAEHFSQTLLNSLGEGMFGIDTEGRFIFVNPAALNLLGYDDENELLGHNSHRLTHHTDAEGQPYPEEHCPIYQVMQTGDPLAAWQDWFWRRDGSAFPVDVYANPLGSPEEGPITGTVVVFTDITKRKEAEANRRRELEFFSGGPVVVFVWRPEPGWPVHYVSANVEQVLGYHLDEIMAPDFRFIDLVHPDDVERIGKEVTTYLARGETAFEQYYRLRTRSGDYRWFYDYTAPEYDEAGQPRLIRGYILDRTEERQAQEQLAENEERWRFVLEATDQGIWDWDTTTDSIYFSPKWKHMLGHAEHEVGNSLDEWKSRVHPDDMDDVMADLEPHLRGETRIYENEHRVRCKDGSYKWILDRGRVIKRTADGQPLRVIGSHTDLTELHRAQERAKEERDFASAIIEGLPGLFYLLSPEGRYVRWNRNLEEVLGLDATALAHTHPRDLFAEDDKPRVDEVMATVFTEGSAQIEAAMRVADGRYVPYYFNGFRVELPDGVYLAGLGVDISEQHRIQEEAQRSNAELEQFAYAVSHDLQEPLRIINSYLGLLERRYGEALDDKAGRYIHTSTEAAERMSRMIQDLLEYSRIKRSGEEFQPVDLNDVLAEALSNLQQARDEAGAIIEADELPTVPGDRGQLVRLFQNLLSNALKYRQPATPLRIHIHCQPRQGQWACAVADNGIGIDPDQAERVFQVFQRLHTREEYAGNGAGLALVQRIVQRHGGQIWVESEGEGTGSTFRFTLPTKDMSQ